MRSELGGAGSGMQSPVFGLVFIPGLQMQPTSWLCQYLPLLGAHPFNSSMVGVSLAQQIPSLFKCMSAGHSHALEAALYTCVAGQLVGSVG